MSNQIRLLHRLARLYNVQLSYRDAAGRLKQAEPYSLISVLKALGAPVDNLTDVSDALRFRKLELWQRYCEPVVISWEGYPVHIKLNLPVQTTQHTMACHLKLEKRKTLRWVYSLEDLPILKSEDIEGNRYEVRQLTIPFKLPLGYHYLNLSLPNKEEEVLIITAPLNTYSLPDKNHKKIWGGFLPLYALQSNESFGAGDFSDLKSLLNWLHNLGGQMVGTLPLLATFLDKPFEPSPYSPISRLFWNEFYLDVNNIEELKNNAKAQQILNSVEFKKEIQSARTKPIVDYRQIMALKRKLLESYADFFFKESYYQQVAFKKWLENNPLAEDYATFRAAMEKQGERWSKWPERMKNGQIGEGDYNPEVKHYHLYVQWLAHQQLEELSNQAKRNNQKLYLDLPVGVHFDGFDVWRYQNAFALEATGGAPPDTFFTEGQNWGFPPIHPEGIRRQHYRYFISTIRNHLQYAGILRIDHVMGLYRLFWIPKGHTAKHGVYVHYNAKEFYAILTLESQRHKALIVGEDLGTVPNEVRSDMKKHSFNRMYVLPFEYNNKRKSLNPISSKVLSCLNTHDMDPFAAFWVKKKKSGDKIATDLPLFLYKNGYLKTLTNNTKTILRACLSYLATSQANILQINLEDLWLETKPQNVPGTIEGNWQKKARYTLEGFSHNTGIINFLKKITNLRSNGKQE